ncbi:DUF5615 family PIN-like protein [Gloeobacter violaceus]|uniref:Gll3981 protein n=1 Tax=Gloeobacter violaceus (strain ATCC 29082 / PCC 7421) TaxID=251221 RepID=Q7NE99_GLOVI|nr:DUF5615 family PIN-like protein [Gloeobacter violaceus]BAC91922.1 gll3981 [Gloeobacter violaceus PCC 7421]
MRFVADENVKREIIERLRRDGHEVFSIFESVRGLVNGEVLALANRQDAVLISADKDMGELVTRYGQPAVGVLLTRLPDHRFTDDEQAELLAGAIAECGPLLRGSLAIVKPEGTRIRPLQQQYSGPKLEA